MAVIQLALIINKQHEAFAPTPELERPQDNVQISLQVGKPQLPQHGSQEVLQTAKAYHRQEPMINVLCFLIVLVYYVFKPLWLPLLSKCTAVDSYVF